MNWNSKVLLQNNLTGIEMKQTEQSTNMKSKWQRMLIESEMANHHWTHILVNNST